MKRFFLSLCLLQVLGSGFAQGPGEAPFSINTLPDDGLLLNRNWTFYPGDDGAVANADFRGKAGIAVDPSLFLDQLPAVKRSGIGWFRLVLRVDSSLRNRTVGMMLSLFGAAEIYLNGQRVYRFGNVSKDGRAEKTQVIYGQAMNLTFGGDETQVLAVRFSHLPGNRYVKTGVSPPCLRIILQPLNKTIFHYAVLVKRAYRFLGIAMTIELASAVLTLFFFFSFPARKEYLFFGLYFCLNFLGVWVQSDLTGVGRPEQVTVNQFGTIQILLYLFLLTGSIFHLNGMYALLQLRRTRYYRFLVGYALVSVATLVFLRGGSVLPDLFFPLACLEILPTYYRAARRKFRGAWILFTSILLCLLFLLALIRSNYEADAGAVLVLTALALLTPALGIVIFLALDFARTSSALQARIVEVENLSAQALAQELEKQEFLAAQKEKLEMEVQHRTAALRKSLSELKAAQVQLVHSEKMASLGELTAGIAHEIQNPLNFINNFSEVGVELLEEAQAGIKNGRQEVTAGALQSARDNLQKVIYHGRRADAIVKGMLQHSRKSTGIKEPTDINALADEYLRLSYHGVRAKDKTFSARIETHFDEGVDSVLLVPQEIGRVLLNLYSNAFYSVAEKQKQLDGRYEPKVSVSTRKVEDAVEVIVNDNGTGIPEKTVEKIFQPFFTTKPTGEGTGLGLSLSYDIVTKGHGGKLEVQTKEGEGSTFTIRLPLGN